MERLLRTEGDGAEKFDKPSPFKVCFVDKPIFGKSDVKTKKQPANAPIAVGKFYDPRNEQVSEKLVAKYVDLLKKDQLMDRESLPKTENQRYGRYQIRLTDADWTDRRLYAHKRTNAIVREHLMNYAKIRE